LVLLAAKRARQIQTGGQDPFVDWDNDKPAVVSLREIADGYIDNEKVKQLEAYNNDDLI